MNELLNCLMGPLAGVLLLSSGLPVARAGELKLETAFRQAYRQNPKIEMARADARAAAAAIGVAEGRFAPRLSAGAEARQRQTPDYGIHGSQLRYNFGVHKLFSSGTLFGFTGTGAQIWGRSSQLQDTIDDLPTAGQADPYYFPDPASGGFALTMSQALLRGAGFAVNEAPARAAQARLMAAEIFLEEQVSAELGRVEVEYWRWAAAVRAVEIRRASLELAEAQRRRTRELIKKGRQAKTDALLADHIVAERQDSLAVAETAAASHYETLYLLMGHGYEEIPSSGDVPEPFGSIDSQLEPLPDLLAEASRSSYLLRWLGHEKLAIEQGLLRQEDAAWPTLDARASMEVYGTDRALGSAYGQAFALKNRAFTGGLVFAYPLGIDPEAAQAERLRAQLRRQKSRIGDAFRETQVAVGTARRQVALALNRISLATLSKGLAIEKLRAEEERYNIGRTTMQDLRIFQEDLDEASLREVQAQVSYRVARAQLDHLLGRYMERRHITP